MDKHWKQRLDRAHAGLVQREDPVAWVTEADAVEAVVRYPRLAIRGSLFGVAAREPGGPWRVVVPLQSGMPQETRDSLQSMFFFRAKDDTDDPEVRRGLLAAVRILEEQPVDELEVLGTTYRIVRADEFARAGDDTLEPPRPTDPEPVLRVWERPRGARRSPDTDVLLDPETVNGPMVEALRIGLREFEYTGKRYPADVRADSRRAVVTHPDIAMLPVTFGIVERNGDGWTPHGSLAPTPHEARRSLYDDLTGLWAMVYEWSDEKREQYRQVGEQYRAAGRADEVRVDEREFRICRVERMVRFGPDGPEGPRPSDVDAYGPTKMHPRMDEDGTLHYDESDRGDEDDEVRGVSRVHGVDEVHEVDPSVE
ncbi:DUF5954 family protein [Streptomyces sp. WAC01280]|uniref:DUF5954 family protein n=1 Tax=Streptomyces sp. WAC01280 TaxID=2487424 RepID=UPI001C8E3A71|nr:DUF5954 family protein [Streptomyces sp. WAC01280]